MQRKHLFWFAPLCTFALLTSIFCMMPHNAYSAGNSVSSVPINETEHLNEVSTEYILQSEGDILVLRKSATGEIVQQYDIHPSLLPQTDRELLAVGIATNGGNDLQRLLEDYGE